MDSARNFDLLGELVPQVRVLARTLVLLFQFSYHLTPFLSSTLYHVDLAMDLVVPTA